MRKNKLLASVLCVGMTVSVVAGGALSAAAETPEYTGGAAEIHYAYWQDTLGPYLEECKEKFEALYPDITVVLEPTAWSEYWTKLETAATGGNIADVFQMNGPNIDKYADAGVILSLDDYIADSGLDMSKYPEAMNGLYTIGLWYNKELFDNAGVDYPTDSWTWEDLTAAAEKLTDADNGIYAIDAGYADQGGFYNTVYAAGGYILNEDKTACGFDQEETIQGIKCWIDLMEKGYSPSQASLTENAGYIQFMSGKIAMLFAGDWFAATFTGEDSLVADKIDVQLLPTINGNRASVIHGKANCISAGTENPEAAWTWVSYLAGEEGNTILGNSGAAIPAYTPCSDLFFEQYPQYNMGIFSQEATECAYVYPASLGYNEWADVMWNELVSAYSMEISIEDACANIAEQMNDILAAQ